MVSMMPPEVVLEHMRELMTLKIVGRPVDGAMTRYPQYDGLRTSDLDEATRKVVSEIADALAGRMPADHARRTVFAYLTDAEIATLQAISDAYPHKISDILTMHVIRGVAMVKAEVEQQTGKPQQ